MSAALALPAASLPGESGAPFVAIDFETADAGRDSACAVALVRVEGERIVRSEGRFLRPPRISSANTHVHGISEATQRSARPLREVWPELAPLLDGVGLLVAHNAPFDRSVLRASWAVAGLTPPGLPWACTMDMGRRLWPKPAIVPDHKLPTLARLWGIPLKHHDATSDAEACARLVLAARAEARGERPAPGRPAPVLPAPVFAPTPRPAAPSPPLDAQAGLRARCVELLELGRAARVGGGDPLRLQEEAGQPVEAALLSCGWLLEDLEQDLVRLHRRQAEDVRLECRFDGLLRILALPRGAQPNFVEQVRGMIAAGDRRRREWRNSSPEQRRELDEAAEVAQDAVRTSLGALGGAR
jgi:DNA polymerase-3 subunit epsilon